MRTNPIIFSVLAAALGTAPVGAQDTPGDKEQTAPKTPAKEQPLKADPARDRFELALLSYREATEQKDPTRQRETYLAAIKQFDRFHSDFPQHPNAIKSWYYSAVCYQKLGNLKKFRECLTQVVTNWKEGPLVGAAAYQLAQDDYKARRYAEAIPLFKLAAEQTDNEAYRHRALYSQALSFEKLGQRPETIAALQAVLADPDSPFREQAQRVLAHYFKKDGKKEEALAHFLSLAKSADPKTKADAILQCALLSRDLKKQNDAKRYFEAIFVTPGLEEWRGEAQLSLMSEASLAGNHQAVIDYYLKGSFPLDKDPQSRRLQLAARAYEKLGQKEKSTALFRELSKIAPDDMTAFEAGYVVITREYKVGSRNLTLQAEQFLKRFESEHPSDPRVHNVWLMLGEAHFKANRFGPAAKAYAKIDLRHIASENHPGVRYRLASALLQSDDREGALAAFNRFIEKHPDDPRAVHAIVKRAESHLEAGEIPLAHDEFARLIAVADDPKLKEYAWAQKANLYKDANDFANLAECHRRLLADFPQRDAERKAASEFWLGWALYRLNQFEDCLQPFKRAREADPGSLGRESTLHLALANYQLRRRDDLKTELDALVKNFPQETIPRPVFAWLGAAFATVENYPEAWRYLKHAITPKEPAKTKVIVWRAAGRSALEAGAYQDALRPLEIVLQVEDNDYRKAETNYFLARAHFKLKDPERARKAATACLEFKPQGILNAQARLLLGDIAMSQGDPNTGAQHYVVVVEFYSKDREIALKALRRAIHALELKGSAEARKSANRYRQRLEKLQNAAQTPPSG